MNERIRELAQLAGAEFFEDKGIQILPNGIWRATKFENHKNLDLEKFAELIVRECADVIDGRDENGNAKDGQYLLTQFGIDAGQRYT